MLELRSNFPLLEPQTQNKAECPDLPPTPTTTTPSPNSDQLYILSRMLKFKIKPGNPTTPSPEHSYSRLNPRISQANPYCTSPNTCSLNYAYRDTKTQNEPQAQNKPEPRFEPQVSRLAITLLGSQVTHTLTHKDIKSKTNTSHFGTPKSRICLPKTEPKISRLAITTSEPQILQQLHLHEDTETSILTYLRTPNQNKPDQI